MIIPGMMKGQDFGPLGEIEHDWAPVGLTLIKGLDLDSSGAESNGAGKTHLYTLLTWIIFGVTLDGDRTDVIRYGQKRAQGDFWFMVEDGNGGGLEYHITRSRTKSGSRLRLEQDGKDITIRGVRETQELIDEIWGLDMETWRNTVLFGQNDTRRFADLNTPDPERKAVMERALGLEVVKKALEVVKQKVRDAQASIAKSHMRAPALEAQVVAAESSVTALGMEIDRHEAVRKGLQERLKQLPALRRKMAGLQRKTKAGDKAQELIDTARKAAQVAQAEQVTAHADARVSWIDQRKAGESLAQFEDGKCPTCGTPTDGEHVAAKMGAIHAEAIAAGEAAQGYDRKAEQAAEHMREAQERVSILSQTQAEARAVQAEVVKVQAEIAALGEVQEADKWAADTIRRHRESITDREHQAKEALAELVKIREKVRIVQADIQHFEFWVKGFGGQGIVNHVIDSVIPALQTRANEHLDTLADGDIKVEFDTQTVLKSGDIRDKFAIHLIIEGVPGVRPSGGQAKKVEIATNLALMDLLSARAKAPVDLLLLDEVLDGLDSVGQARVVDLLMDLRQRRSRINVISHAADLANVFDRTVTVIKEGGVSRLE